MFSRVPGTNPAARTLSSMGHGETTPEHLPEDFAQRQQGTAPTQVAFIHHPPKPIFSVLSMEGIWGRGVPGFMELTPPWGR